MKKDSAIIKALTELGLRSEPEIPEALKKAYPKNLEDDEQFMDAVESLFKTNGTKLGES